MARWKSTLFRNRDARGRPDRWQGSRSENAQDNSHDRSSNISHGGVRLGVLSTAPSVMRSHTHAQQHGTSKSSHSNTKQAKAHTATRNKQKLAQQHYPPINSGSTSCPPGNTSLAFRAHCTRGPQALGFRGHRAVRWYDVLQSSSRVYGMIRFSAGKKLTSGLPCRTAEKTCQISAR